MAKKAIYDNLGNIENKEDLTNRIDEAIRETKKDNWRGHKIKERQVKNAIAKAIEEYFRGTSVKENIIAENTETYLTFDKDKLVEKLFNIVKKQPEY